MTTLAPVRGTPWVFAILLLLLGLALGGGGAQLALLGGSLYYLVTGVALVATASLLWRGRRAGMWLYLAVLAYTLVWSLWEVGFDGWSLASRLGLFVLLGLYFLLPHTRRHLA
jgi:quinoprotein glucose dehydrogenase